MKHLAMKQTLDEIRPLTNDLREAFDISIGKADEIQARHYHMGSGGYLRSMLTRCGVKEYLIGLGYTLGHVANEGIEIPFLGRYVIKVLRSNHAGVVPAPTTISRAAWCSRGQMQLTPANEPAESFWGIKRLGLPGCGIDAAIVSALKTQDDDLTHLLVDWEEIPNLGTVRMAVSLPMGSWKEGERPSVAWRYVLEQNAGGETRFVPSDDDFNVFLDDDEGDEVVGVVVG